MVSQSASQADNLPAVQITLLEQEETGGGKMTRTMRISKISLSDNQTASVELDVVVDGKKTYGGYLVLNNLPIHNTFVIGEEFTLTLELSHVAA